MRSVDARVQPRAGGERQHVLLSVEDPDPGQRRVQIPDHRQGAALEDSAEAVGRRQRLTHLSYERRQPRLLHAFALFIPPLGDQTRADFHADDPGEQKQ